MSVLAERLDNMYVRVASPAGNIVAELSGRTDVRLSFSAESYRYLNERELERQLVGLGKLLWAARTREYYAAVSEAFGETVTGEPPPIGPRDVEFHEARDELVAEGRSDGTIQVSVRGMQVWTVRIADGTVRRLTEQEFAARVQEAAGQLIRDQFRKIGLLKAKIYG
ncbi:hypothetical protein [Plantactinospora sp. CA-290183]|uniref:hypothetical protein n=1 Tax=Plantactinospora sp. CA-290183 TaxID=3240006 RepID=UPI003D8A341D